MTNSLVHSIKNYKKAERERRVLFGVVELYIALARPVGSHALKEAGFDDLSSATIRNYFSKLEQEGFLTQQHSSGGRTPTNAAFEFYADDQRSAPIRLPEVEQLFENLNAPQTIQLSPYLQRAAALLSRATQTAVFISAPRFDHDAVLEVRLIAIDQTRCLVVILTQFGLVRTETLYVDCKLTDALLRNLENYFQARLRGAPLQTMPSEELKLAQQMYSETMLRYLASYSHFNSEEVYRTGFSQLLSYTEFSHPLALANALALFENGESLRTIASQALASPRISLWVGTQLERFLPQTCHCSVLAVPYRIGQTAVGVAGLIGPLRMPYRELFGTLEIFSQYVSQTLTRSVHQFKLQFRQPKTDSAQMESSDNLLIATDLEKIAQTPF